MLKGDRSEFESLTAYGWCCWCQVLSQRELAMERLQEAVKRLVLSRKVGESIDFDGIIRITVVRAGLSQTRLLIEAPEDIHVVRTELTKRERKAS